MNKENKKEKKKLDISVWVLFGVAMIIIVFFLWYFFIYVNNNEKLQIQKNFRVLTQISENFKSRYGSFSKVVGSRDMETQLEQNKAEIKKYFFGIELVGLKPTLEYDYVYFKGINNNFFNIDKEEFFQPLLRKDVFEEIIVIKEDSVSSNASAMFYNSFPGDIAVKNLDSLISNKKGLLSGSIADVNILGIDYKLFITQIKISNSGSYYVGGVISKDKYEKDIRAINFYVALIIIIIFFTFLLSVPLIKLKFISENQKLKVSDLLLAAMSILFGTFFLLLIIFNIISYARSEGKLDTSLKYISHSIDSSLVDEIKKIDYTLGLYIDSLSKNKTLQFPDTTRNDFYNYFKLVFRLDPQGEQDSISTSRNKTSSRSNYKFRRYFYESGEWTLEGRKLMLDFIFSNTSNEQLGVVSKKEGNYVFVITSKFYSVINTILPPGFGFCVIDELGDVKFHSDPNRMLRENFVDETEHSSELMAAIKGNLKTNFTVKYLGKNHTCYISPVSTLPLYLVTFFDNSYTNSVNLQVTSLTILFIFLMLLLFLVTVFSARFIVYRKSELKQNIDIVDWLRPLNWKTEMYRKIILSNFIAIVLMIISCLLLEPENTLFIIFLFIPLQIIAVYYYTNSLVRDSLQKKYSLIQFIPSVIFIICILYFANKISEAMPAILVFGFLLVICDLLILKYFKIIDPESNKPKYFYAYLFSWLGLIVVTPLIIFSTIFYNHEASAELTHKLFSHAVNEAKRNYDIDKFYYDYVDKKFDNFRTGSKRKGVYYTDNVKKLPDSTEFYLKRNDSTTGKLDEMLFYLKPDLDNLSVERKSFSKRIPGYVNESIQTTSDSVIIKYSAYQTHQSVNDSLQTDSSQTSYYKGSIFKFGFSKPEGVIFFLFILLLSLYFIYKSIIFTCERIFGIAIKRKQIFSNTLKSSVESGNNFIIQCTDLSDKDIEHSLSQYSFSKFDYHQPGLTELITKIENEKHIFIKNLYPDFEKLSNDEEKLKSIIELVNEGDIQIVLISEQSVEKLIEIVKQKIKFQKEDDSQKPLMKIQSLLEIIDKNFVHVYAPINEIYVPGLNEYLNNRLNQASISEVAKPIIHDELVHLGISNDTIKNYTEVLIDYVKREETENDNIIEKIVLKVQELATGYYEKVWETCTSEEKLLLMDISDNHLLNDKNKKVIETLINKGLLKKDISVEMINRSFRNFVSAKSLRDDVKEYQEARKKGNWANYRAPILLILFAVAFFLVLQENILSSITSILPVVLGIITVITKISGVFPGSGATKSGATT